MRDIEIKIDENGYANYVEHFIANQYENEASQLVFDLPPCYVGKGYYQYAVFTLSNDKSIIRKIVDSKCIIDRDITNVAGLTLVQVIVKNIEGADDLSDGLVVCSQPISCYIKQSSYNSDKITNESIDKNIIVLLDEFDALLAEIRKADDRFKAITDASSNMSEVIDARAGYKVLRNRLDSLTNLISNNSSNIKINTSNITKNSSNLSSLNQKINTLIKNTFCKAESIDDMVDTTKLYVLTSDGNWYYYNGETWVIGGIFQAIEIADKSINVEKTDFIKRLNLIDINNFTVLDDTRFYKADVSYLIGNNIIFKSDVGALIDFEISEGTYNTPVYYELKKENLINVPENAINIRIRYGVNDVSTLNYITLMAESDYNEFKDVEFNNLYCKLYELEKVKSEIKIIYDEIARIVFDFSKNYQENTDIVWTEGYYFSANGVLTEDKGYKVTDYLPVSYGDKIKIHGACEYNTRIYNFYDKYKNVIGSYPSENKEYNYIEEVEVIIPENVAYIRLCSPTRYNTIFYYLLKYNSINIDDVESNVLNNKTLLFTGDSICYGAGERPDVEDWKDTGWVKRIRENNPLSNVYGYGLGGTTIAKRKDKTNSILERLDTMLAENPDADYIIIQGGVNDAYCYETIPLGEISTGYNEELDEYTFSGALESLFKKAQLKWQGKKIGFIVTFKIPSASYLNDYMERAKEICEKYSVPYLDLFKSSGLNYHLTEIKDNYSDNADGCHPNSKGYDFISPIIEKWIKSL